MLNIVSADNNAVKQIVKLNSSRSKRYEEKLFAIEGLRLCTDAFKSGVKVKTVFATSDALNKHKADVDEILNGGAELAVVSPAVFSKISDTKSPQGIVCLCRMLDKNAGLYTINNNGLYVCLETIQDPGNMGTIIRTAEALGFSGIVLSNDCCDIYNPKVMRSAMGGTFRMQFYEAQDMQEACRELNSMGLETYAAVVDKTAESVADIDFKGKGALFIGNEGGGLTQKTAGECKRKITIKMRGRAESLNAALAAGIIMWEMQK